MAASSSSSRVVAPVAINPMEVLLDSTINNLINDLKVNRSIFNPLRKETVVLFNEIRSKIPEVNVNPSAVLLGIVIYSFNKLYNQSVDYGTGIERKVADLLYERQYERISPVARYKTPSVPSAAAPVGVGGIDEFIGQLIPDRGTICGYQIGGKIGKGLSTVYSTDTIGGRPQAIKIQQGGGTADAARWRSFTREAAANRLIGGIYDDNEFLVAHSFGVKCREPGKGDKLISIGERGEMDLFEFVTMDQFSLFNTTAAADNKTVRFKIMLDLICQLYQMHMMGISHNDLKFENVVLLLKPAAAASVVKAKIIDLGHAALVENLHDGGIDYAYTGTQNYRDTGILCGAKKFGPEFDVWVLGTIAATLLLGVMPLAAENSRQLTRTLFNTTSYSNAVAKGDDLSDFERDLADEKQYNQKEANFCRGAIRSLRNRVVTSAASTGRIGSGLVSFKSLPWPAYHTLSSEARRYLDGTLYTHEEYAAIVTAIDWMTQLDPKKRWTMQQIIDSPFYSILLNGAMPLTGAVSSATEYCSAYKVKNVTPAAAAAQVDSRFLAELLNAHFSKMISDGELKLSERDVKLYPQVVLAIAQNQLHDPAIGTIPYTLEHLDLDRRLSMAIHFDLLSDLRTL
jgi:serine/threonine protein kinase